jgi:hypothetical protein
MTDGPQKPLTLEALRNLLWREGLGADIVGNSLRVHRYMRVKYVGRALDNQGYSMDDIRYHPDQDNSGIAWVSLPWSPNDD